MFREEQGTERVDLEGGQRLGVVDLGWGLLGMKDAGDAESETEVTGWKTRFAMRGRIRDGTFI